MYGFGSRADSNVILLSSVIGLINTFVVRFQKLLRSYHQLTQILTLCCYCDVSINQAEENEWIAGDSKELYIIGFNDLTYSLDLKFKGV